MKTRTTFLFLCLAALSAAALHAASRQVVLGAGGELYTVRAGTYGELFAGGTEADPGNRVLALEVSRPGLATKRLLVEGTRGDDVESSPSLFFENASKSVFLVWESRLNPLHSVLYLVSLNGEEWSSVIPISGDRYSFKSSPRIAVTRDTFDTSGDSAPPVTRRRTVIHTVWWERADGGDRAVYAPVILLDGAYLGWNPVYRLEDLVTPSDTPGIAVREQLLHAPTIQVGRRGSSVVAAFIDSRTGHLMALDLDVMPGEIARIANKIRTKIIAYRRIPTAQLGAMADDIGREIVELGASFHPSVRNYIAAEVKAEIIDLGSRLPPNQIRRLAGDIRAEIIDLGATVFGPSGGGHGPLPVHTRPPQIAEVPSTADGDGGDADIPSHLVAVHVAADLSAPETGTTANSLYLSGDGKSVLVSWEQDGQIRYRESEADGWTEVLSLNLGPTLTREQAEQILEQRALGR